MKLTSDELKNIPLTETILQSCYKSKTYIRNGEWHILWHLGGKNNVTIGEKRITKSSHSSTEELTEVSEFYFIPDTAKKETVTVLLPKGLEHCQNQANSAQPILLLTVADLEKVFPEFRNIISRGKLKI